MICDISFLGLKYVAFLLFFLFLWPCSFVAFITPSIFMCPVSSVSKCSSTPFWYMRPCIYTKEVVSVNWKSVWLVFNPYIYIPIAFSRTSRRWYSVVLWPSLNVPEIVHLPTVCTQPLALDSRNWLPHQLLVRSSQLLLYNWQFDANDFEPTASKGRLECDDQCT